MHIQINLNTDEAMTDQDLRVLRALVGDTATETFAAAATVAEEAPAKATPAKKVAPAKKAAPAKKPEPVVEPEPAEEPAATEDAGDGPTMEDVVERATALVGAKKTPLVKEALAAVGAKRVGVLETSQIGAFMAALDAAETKAAAEED